MNLHDEIRKLLSPSDRNELILLIIALAIVLFWLFIASYQGQWLFEILHSLRRHWRGEATGLFLGPPGWHPRSLMANKSLCRNGFFHSCH